MKPHGCPTFTIRKVSPQTAFAIPSSRQSLLTPVNYQISMFPSRKFQLWTARAALGVAVALSLVAAPLHAGTGTTDRGAVDGTTSAIPETTETPDNSASERFPVRAAIRAIIERETATTRLPADIAEAVVFVESRYDSSVVGGVGEIGVMQVRPETAKMLGFRGSLTELAELETNIHYGVIYLSKAWRLAGGDLCRALMKYRAGHREEVISPRSQIYCNRARNRLIAMNSAFASPGAIAATDPAVPVGRPATVTPRAEARPKAPISPTAVYATYRQGTAAASRAYWAAHEARIRTIKAQIESRWKRVASR
jgi:hypothetical protein